MVRMQISTIFKKWDLLITLEGKYVCNSCIYTNILRPLHIKCTHVASKLCTQSVVRTLAHSEDFCTRVVHALLHTRVFVKFKSSCTVPTCTHSVKTHVLAVRVYNNFVLAM